MELMHLPFRKNPGKFFSVIHLMLLHSTCKPKIMTCLIIQFIMMQTNVCWEINNGIQETIN